MAGAAQAQKKYDVGQRHRDQGRQHRCLFRSRLSLWRDRQDRGSLFQDDQRSGGINGRKINFISYDDGYSPPKTVEQARKLVESTKS